MQRKQDFLDVYKQSNRISAVLRWPFAIHLNIKMMWSDFFLFYGLLLNKSDSLSRTFNHLSFNQTIQLQSCKTRA